jgi:hypothetical protein
MPERLGRRVWDPATLLAIGMLASAGLLLFWGS